MYAHWRVGVVYRIRKIRLIVECPTVTNRFFVFKYDVRIFSSVFLSVFVAVFYFYEPLVSRRSVLPHTHDRVRCYLEDKELRKINKETRQELCVRFTRAFVSYNIQGALEGSGVMSRVRDLCTCRGHLHNKLTVYISILCVL